jgi:outer membrane biosynthesis protein TonB
MAGFTPRKQGLHDLMSATYVVREGPARVVPALAVAVGGFAIPMVVAPMILGAAMVSSMTSMAQGLVSETPPIKPAPRPIATAPKAPPKPAPATPPAPVVVAKAPEQPAAPPAPAPAPVAAPEVKTAPEATPVPEPKPKAVAATPKPKVASAKAKPDTSGMKVAARPSRPAAQPDDLKRVTGLRHNDLMSAVLDSDVESVNALLRMGKWADKPDSQGVTPLMIAAERGDLKVAEALLRGGADGRSAAQVAQKRGDGDMMVLFARYRR